MADKVLIADDDPAIRKLLEKVMHSNDLETMTAESGAEALALINAHSFDLILTIFSKKSPTSKVVG